MLHSGSFHGPTWRNTLEKNSTLRELGLSQCSLGGCSVVDWESFMTGPACNTSLKILDLSLNRIGTAQKVSALGGAIEDNDVLESLDLSGNHIEGPDGVRFVRLLWLKRNLLHLDLSFNFFGGQDDDDMNATTVFTDGLPKNETLKTLKLDCCRLSTSDFCVVVNSLYGSRALETVFAGKVEICADGLAMIALKELLLSSPLKELDMRDAQVNRESMAQVAAGLCGNTRLKKLNVP